jgi:hypothetical protein
MRKTAMTPKTVVGHTVKKTNGIDVGQNRGENASEPQPPRHDLLWKCTRKR